MYVSNTGKNVVSVWDDVYDARVRDLGLQPEIYRDGRFDEGYRPSFAGDIHPIFRAASTTSSHLAPWARAPT